MRDATVISVINWKGGVGKTTLTHHLATGLHHLSGEPWYELLGEPRLPKILLIDADAQCNLSISCLTTTEYEHRAHQSRIPFLTFKDLVEQALKDEPLDYQSYLLRNSIQENGRSAYEGIDLIPSHSDLIYTDMDIAAFTKPSFRDNLAQSENYKFQLLERIMVRARQDYDFIFIDCPPNLNYITQNALYCSDYYVIPTLPDTLSSYGIMSITKKVDELNHTFSLTTPSYRKTKLIGIIPNKINERNGHPKTSQANTLSLLRASFPQQVFENYLTDGDGISMASFHGVPVYAHASTNSNAKKQSDSLLKILKEFLTRIRSGVTQ